MFLLKPRGRNLIDKFTENREEEVFGLSVISIAELLHGVNRADSTRRRLRRSAYVEKVIERFPMGLGLGFRLQVRLFRQAHTRLVYFRQVTA